MKIVYVLAFLLLPSSLVGAEYLEQVETDVYQTTGTVKEIFTKAKSCLAQIVRNEGVRMADSAVGEGIQGGDIFVEANAETGIITANSRVDYKAKMLEYNVKSTLVFMAKEGRFKMRHSNIEYLQKYTGSVNNTGYSRVGKWFGTGWKDTQKALLGASEKVAQCVMVEPKKEEW